jgi:hypothetical protein
MFGFVFTTPKGRSYRRGYRVDAFMEGVHWRGIVYDAQGIATPVDLAASTKDEALRRAREIVDYQIALQRWFHRR